MKLLFHSLFIGALILLAFATHAASTKQIEIRCVSPGEMEAFLFDHKKYQREVVWSGTTITLPGEPGRNIAMFMDERLNYVLVLRDLATGERCIMTTGSVQSYSTK